MLLKELLKDLELKEKDFGELKNKEIIASRSHEFGYIVILDDFTSLFIYAFMITKLKPFNNIEDKMDLKKLIKTIDKSGKILNKKKYEEFKLYVLIKQI